MTSSTSAAAAPQPTPKGDGTPIAPLVKQDIDARVTMGYKKYGTLLRAGNGRDALMDAYQEAIDLVMYLRQAIEEKAEAQQTDTLSGLRTKIDEVDRDIERAMDNIWEGGSVAKSILIQAQEKLRGLRE